MGEGEKLPPCQALGQSETFKKNIFREQIKNLSFMESLNRSNSSLIFEFSRNIRKLFFKEAGKITFILLGKRTWKPSPWDNPHADPFYVLLSPISTGVFSIRL